MEKRINLSFYFAFILLFVLISLAQVNGRTTKKPSIPSKFNILKGWEYKNDSTTLIVKASNDKDCMIRCYNTSACVAFTWKPKKPSSRSYSCSLMSNINKGEKKNKNAISGHRREKVSNNKTDTVNTTQIIGQQIESTNMSYNNSQQNDQSPLISELTWGRITIEGIDEPFRDVKLFPGGAVAWDWRKTGTRHEPGTQPADLEELFENHCEIIILSRGIENRLKTTEETRELLEQRGMKLNQNYFILQSEKAKNLYNQLAAQNKRVCAIIHSTC